MQNCLRCGSEAEMLLNLQSCTSPRCVNFNSKFYSKWLPKQAPHYYDLKDTGWFIGLSFLGPYYEKKAKISYDLYLYSSGVLAVYGQPSLGMGQGQPIYLGHRDTGLATGVYLDYWGIEEVSESGKEALLEASARANQ